MQLLLVERSALLMADDQHGATAKPAEPADDGRVVGAQAVALELLEALNEVPDVVARPRPALVTRDLDGHPGIMATFLVLQAPQSRLQLVDLLRQMDAGHKRQTL